MIYNIEEMSQIVEFIQKEALKIYKNKYSKKYIKLKILPIINHIILSNKKKFLIGGSQGIGKSSMIIIIKNTIEKFTKKRVLSLSLDDYYLSKNERKNLAKNVHELLLTRGVPGTHNIKRLIEDIKKFERNKYPIITPFFDKLTDSKLKKKNKINKKCDLLILEGWCCGCNYIDNNYLYKNINFIEIKYDKDFKWRNFYNKKLKNDYKNLFNLFDEKIFLKAPSFKFVLEWRKKQEKLNSSLSAKAKKMNSEEIKIFIQHYEKITKWMMKTMPAYADILIKIDRNQKIKKVII